MFEFLLKENKKLDEAIENAYMVTLNVFTVRVNYMVGRSLFRDPEAFNLLASIVRGTSRSK